MFDERSINVDPVFFQWCEAVGWDRYFPGFLCNQLTLLECGILRLYNVSSPGSVLDSIYISSSKHGDLLTMA